MADDKLLSSDEEVSGSSEVEEQPNEDNHEMDPSSARQRPRGRPPKAGTATGEVINAPPKKKRGRPTKNDAVDKSEETEFSD